MVLDADMNHHKYIFVDEVGFNLAKTRRRGQNIIDQRANVQMPGQRGGNISMCAATSENGVIGRRPLLGSYNAAHLIEFLKEIELACQGEGVTYVIVWDNVRFHHAEVVQAWFQAHPRFMTLYLPPFFSFPQPYWGFFLSQSLERATLLQAMDEACDDISVVQCQAWIRHAKSFFPRYMNNDDIHCDVDENLWPNDQDRLDPN